MAALTPAQLIKNIDRVLLLKEILKTDGILYKVGVNNPQKVAPFNKGKGKNQEVIEILEKATKNNLSSIQNELRGKGIYFGNETSTTSFSKIEKDSRFVEINLGHTFELIFAAASIAAIKSRPNNLIGTMPIVSENDVKTILFDAIKGKGILKYTAKGYSLSNDATHNDILQLHYDKNSLAYKGMEKFISDNDEYNNKKNKLITPALKYVNSPEIKTIRETLFTNGVVDTYTVNLIGGEQQKPDVKISISREGQRQDEIKLISLKLNSTTFGVVKGGTEESMQTLFSKFDIPISVNKKGNIVKNSYISAKDSFNKMSIDSQLQTVQKALNEFYGGSVIEKGFEVLKFTTKTKSTNVFKRLFKEFTEKYKNEYKNKKMKIELVSGTSGISLIFKFPDNKSFLKIRNRTIEGNIRHEIEEMSGLQKLIGTQPI